MLQCALCVCLSVCRSQPWALQKHINQIEMLFCLRTRVGSSNQVLGVGQIPRRNGQFWGLFHSLKCTKLCKQQTPQQPRAAQLCTLVILLAFSLLTDFRLTTIRTRSGGKYRNGSFLSFLLPSLRSRLPFIQLWGLGKRFVYFSCKIWYLVATILRTVSYTHLTLPTIYSV